MLFWIQSYSFSFVNKNLHCWRGKAIFVLVEQMCLQMFIVKIKQHEFKNQAKHWFLCKKCSDLLQYYNKYTDEEA